MVALSLGRGPLVPSVTAAVIVGVAGILTARHLRSRRACAGPPDRRRLGVVLTLLLAAALQVVVAGAEARSEAGPVAELASERAFVRVTGQVMAEPRRLRRTEAGPARVAVVLRVQRVEARGVRTAVETPVLLLGDADRLRVGWRDVVEVTGRLAPADAGEQVRAVLTTRSTPTVVTGPGWLVAAADRARAAMREAVGGLPEDPKGLVPGMVIGDRDGLPEDLADAMTATGMSHLTAVSGTNCSLVGAAVLWVCAGLGVPRRWRPLAGGLALAGFVVLVRPDPSVIRAAVMGGIGLLGILRSRRSLGMPALAGAVLILLAIDPWLARSYGFALSVLATVGLLVFARPWADALRRRVPRPGFAAEALAIPLAAQVTCAPVVVLLQGEISIVGVLANALAAPLVVPVTVVGTLVAVLGVAWPAAAGLVAWVAAIPAWGVALVARWAERAPLRAIPWPDTAVGAFSLALLTLAVVMCGPALCRACGRRPRAAMLVVLLLVAAILPASCVRTRTGFPGPDPAIVMCDIGQGDAIVLMSGPGRAVVVDTGPDPDLLDRCLDSLRISVVDAVVLTHFDTDHSGGLSGVDRGREVGDLVVSVASLAEVPPQVRRWWTEHGRPVHSGIRGDRFTWGRVSALVRWPRSATAPSPNAGSLVLDVTVAGATTPQDDIRALLLADIDEEAGAAVRTDLRAHPAAADPTRSDPFDIVKVAHHGSADHDPKLLTTVLAPVALVSVGADNTYGHPAPSLLGSVGKAGSVLYRTDRDGAVAVRKDGGQVLVLRQNPAG